MGSNLWDLVEGLGLGDKAPALWWAELEKSRSELKNFEVSANLSEETMLVVVLVKDVPEYPVPERMRGNRRYQGYYLAGGV